jgi:hypothetical protein
MKSQFVPVLSLLIILCPSEVNIAQRSGESATATADTMREKIEQLEKTELTSRSATVRDMYKRTLLRLYAEFSKALENDIADVRRIEATIHGIPSENANEIAAQLKKLIVERDVVIEKLRMMKEDPDASALSFSPASQSMLATTAPAAVLTSQRAMVVSEDSARGKNNLPAVAAAAAPPPVAVTGLVTIKNNGATFNAKGAKVVFSEVKANGDREPLAETVTDANGNYSITVTTNATSQYVVTASVAQSSVEAPFIGASPVNIDLVVRPLGSFSRAIVGFEQAGASSARSTQRFFMDLTLSSPLPWGNVDPFFGRRARSWGSIRITSVPQQITTGVAEFAGAFAQNVGEVKVNELAQGVEFLAGGEYRLTGSGTSRFGSFGSETSTRFTLSFILGGGIITPFNPRETLEIFKVFPDAPSLPTIPAGKDFVAFVSPDRDRFFRQYYAGFRVQTYYFDFRNPDVPMKRYPATLDITYGQNEAVTGGRLRGGVIRLEGFYPLPYDGLKFINLFGTALIKPSRTKITDPLILEAAPAGTTVPANNVFLLTIPQINRDYYRVGVGIDFMSLISKWRAASH